MASPQDQARPTYSTTSLSSVFLTPSFSPYMGRPEDYSTQKMDILLSMELNLTMNLEEWMMHSRASGKLLNVAASRRWSASLWLCLVRSGAENRTTPCLDHDPVSLLNPTQVGRPV